MDFITTYKILFNSLRDIEEDIEADRVKITHDNNNKRIKRNYAISRENERKLYLSKLNRIRDKLERNRTSKFKKILRAVSQHVFQ